MATTMQNNSPFLGTELKLNINIEPMVDTTMDDYDFIVDAYCSVKKPISIPKKDAIRVDENNYMVLIDTNLIGSGRLKCRITAYVPDADFEDGLRTEVVGIDTGIEIQKHI